MSIDICTDYDNNVQLLYCNTADWAFGPVFYPDQDNYTAEDFLDWYQGPDLRTLSDNELANKVGEFRSRYIDREIVKWSDVGCVVLAARWLDDDRPLTEKELENLTEQNPEEINTLACEWAAQINADRLDKLEALKEDRHE
jgi:hypothetical protein